MSELRELLEKATPGKWSVCRDSFGLIKSDYKEGTKHERRYPMVGGDREANAALIVHLRNNAETYAGLADDNKRLEERVAELEAARSARSAGLAEWSAASASRSAVNESIADKLIELLDDKP